MPFSFRKPLAHTKGLCFYIRAQVTLALACDWSSMNEGAVLSAMTPSLSDVAISERPEGEETALGLAPYCITLVMPLV